ncbi:hypothetical protein Poli38472_006745 [Pythium oligandrum]|uniref:Mitochondrial splicing suppressor 51-like C-terminal domain-containing protein n=1 Tax=Pythium oligandrum TaxID=41045 RepID=A0A8K1C5I8_PYTOL|nr:hypothetical protein Poli38472_006745 [Pythium oligandrum]|eukprot:TMW56735.1 hypothetical protein Poli38472_006745 [Pythium oligandrum]
MTRTKRASRRADGATSDKTTTKDLQLDPRGDGMYSGTFRWLETKKFAQLPAFPSLGSQVCLTSGWEGFLRSRSSRTTNLVEIATQDPSCLDALSFPITFAHVATLLSLMDARTQEKHVVVLGATRKAEQRVWAITDYWLELAHLFSETQLTLWFIGPEVDSQCPTKPMPRNLRVQHIQGKFLEFRNNPASNVLTPSNTVLIGYNTGFGNFVESERHELLFSWLPDLYDIADSGFPAIFTCANDYADMKGEFAVQSRVVGAKMLLLPQQNPFSAASHLHEEGKRETAWSRGNSFLYAIQGVDSSRRVRIASRDVKKLQDRLDEELDLHLIDTLGRHFYKGMVLTKEQASRCKALNGSSTTSSTTKPKTAVSTNASAESQLQTPPFQILPGQGPKDNVILVHVPEVKSAQERIAVDVADTALTVYVPDKYLLRTKLPFAVENNGSVQVALSTPFLQIHVTRV